MSAQPSSFEERFRAMVGALERAAKAYGDYMKLVDVAGQRLNPLKWAGVRAAGSLPENLARLAIPRGGFAALADLLDAADAAWNDVARALPTLLSPELLSLATSGMSHSYLLHAQNKLTQVKDAFRAATAAYEELMAFLESEAAAVLVAGEPVAQLEAGYEGRSALATTLYLSALRTAPATDAERRRVLDDARTVALGGRPESAARIVAAVAARAEQHPLQALGVLGGEMANCEAKENVLDMRWRIAAPPLPGSSQTVVYDLAPLVDRKTIAALGGGSTESGLGYKLVQRLKTIRAVAVELPPQPEAARPAWVEGPLCFDSGGGPRTVTPLAGKTTRWAPFAGPRPRVALYARHAGAIIGDALPPRDFLAQFAPVSDNVTERLCEELPTKFEEALAAAWPRLKTRRDFQDFVTQTPTTESWAAIGYVQAAVAAAGYPPLERALLTPALAGTVTGPLDYAALRREVSAYHFVWTMNAAKGILKVIRRAYASPEAEEWSSEMSEARPKIVAHFKRAVLPQISGGEPIEIAIPLKLAVFARPSPN